VQPIARWMRCLAARSRKPSNREDLLDRKVEVVVERQREQVAPEAGGRAAASRSIRSAKSPIRRLPDLNVGGKRSSAQHAHVGGPCGTRWRQSPGTRAGTFAPGRNGQASAALSARPSWTASLRLVFRSARHRQSKADQGQARALIEARSSPAFARRGGSRTVADPNFRNRVLTPDRPDLLRANINSSDFGYRNGGPMT